MMISIDCNFCSMGLCVHLIRFVMAHSSVGENQRYIGESGTVSLGGTRPHRNQRQRTDEYVLAAGQERIR